MRRQFTSLVKLNTLFFTNRNHFSMYKSPSQTKKLRFYPGTLLHNPFFQMFNTNFQTKMKTQPLPSIFELFELYRNQFVSILRMNKRLNAFGQRYLNLNMGYTIPETNTYILNYHIYHMHGNIQGTLLRGLQQIFLGYQIVDTILDLQLENQLQSEGELELIKYSSNYEIYLNIFIFKVKQQDLDYQNRKILNFSGWEIKTFKLTLNDAKKLLIKVLESLRKLQKRDDHTLETIMEDHEKIFQMNGVKTIKGLIMPYCCQSEMPKEQVE